MCYPTCLHGDVHDLAMTYPWQPVFPNVAPKDAGGYPQMDGFNHRGGFGVPNFDQTQEKTSRAREVP